MLNAAVTPIRDCSCACNARGRWRGGVVISKHFIFASQVKKVLAGPRHAEALLVRGWDGLARINSPDRLRGCRPSSTLEKMPLVPRTRTRLCSVNRIVTNSMQDKVSRIWDRLLGGDGTDQNPCSTYLLTGLRLEAVTLLVAKHSTQLQTGIRLLTRVLVNYSPRKVSDPSVDNRKTGSFVENGAARR